AIPVDSKRIAAATRLVAERPRAVAGQGGTRRLRGRAGAANGRGIALAANARGPRADRQRRRWLGGFAFGQGRGTTGRVVEAPEVRRGAARGAGRTGRELHAGPGISAWHRPVETIQAVLRHPDLSEATAGGDRTCETVPRSTVRPRPHRQTVHQGRDRVAVARTDSGVGEGNEYVLQSLRNGHR